MFFQLCRSSTTAINKVFFFVLFFTNSGIMTLYVVNPKQCYTGAVLKIQRGNTDNFGIIVQISP